MTMLLELHETDGDPVAVKASEIACLSIWRDGNGNSGCKVWMCASGNNARPDVPAFWKVSESYDEVKRKLAASGEEP